MDESGRDRVDRPPVLALRRGKEDGWDWIECSDGWWMRRSNEEWWTPMPSKMVARITIKEDKK